MAWEEKSKIIDNANPTHVVFVLFCFKILLVAPGFHFFA
jgi:hypothetical protein